METKELEFRGIPLSQLGLYFEELGGEKLSGEFPCQFCGENWTAWILSEEEIVFNPVWKVNSVRVRFEAGDEAALDELIKKYRYKTTRIGG